MNIYRKTFSTSLAKLQRLLKHPHSRTNKRRIVADTVADTEAVTVADTDTQPDIVQTYTSQGYDEGGGAAAAVS